MVSRDSLPRLRSFSVGFRSTSPPRNPIGARPAQEDAGNFEAALESYQDLSANFPTSRQARHAERRRQWLNQRRDGSEPWEQLRALRQARRQPEPINQEHPITRLADSCDAQKPLCLELRRFVAETLLESGQPEAALSHYQRWLGDNTYAEAQRISWRLGEARARQAIARRGAPRRMHPGSLRVLRPAPSALEGLDEAGLSGSPLAEELERSEQASIIQRSSWAVVGLFGLLCVLSWIRRPPSLAFNPKVLWSR